MKPILMFYQEHCPFCKKALRYIDELKQQSVYSGIQIDMVEETQQPDLADKYDYYYVPTFYIDGIKMHEGGIFPDEMEELLKKALD